MTVSRHEIGMHRLVADIQEERLVCIALIEPVDRKIGQLVGNVALLRDTLSIDVESIVGRLRNLASRPMTIGPIGSLAFEGDPMVETSLWVINISAHVPLANESRFITRLLQLLGKENEIRVDGVVIIDDAVIVSVLASKNRCSTRRTE